jgi:hypothetical protein
VHEIEQVGDANIGTHALENENYVMVSKPTD